MSVREFIGLKNSANFFKRYDTFCDKKVLYRLQEYAFNVDDWLPTKKYSFFHTKVPLELFEDDPYLKFVWTRFGRTLPWILLMPGGTMFDLHTDPSKGCALNMPLTRRTNAVTLYRHSGHTQKFMSNVIPVDYGREGQYTLINNMKSHMVINYDSDVALMFTLPCMLMKPDFVNIIDEYETLCDPSNDYTYREGSGLSNPDMDKMTPKHLELMIFNKVKQILEDNGFE